ncbi:MAG: sigma-70 family RNA polymerase sigma factor [Planctomycetes bacterium]|nr:sigma-70 family RNA polymerase sigma factor [Planctomycetota bacterium]
MDPTPATHAAFHTTRWTLVLAAGCGDDDAARAALEELCAAYWYPLYAFARRKGADRDAAADLVQGLFARLVETRGLRQIARDKGRFRSFLMAALQHHVANERDRERAVKRGGGSVALAVDLDLADERFAREVDRGRTPEQEFDRAWALEVLRGAIGVVEREYRESGRGGVFDALRGELEGEGVAHAEVAVALGMSAGAVKVAAFRLRERFGEALRGVVAGTVVSPAAVEGEMGALWRALG